MEKPINAILLELAHQTEGWSTINCQVRIEQTLYLRVGSAEPGRSTSTEEYLARSSGQRMFASFSTDRNERLKWVQHGYADGNRCADVRYQDSLNGESQKSVTIAKNFLGETRIGYVTQPEILRFYSVGLVPITEALAKAERHGLSRVGDRECIRFYFAGIPDTKRGQDLVYDLDQATSAIMRVAAYANRDRFNADDPNWFWEVRKLDDIQGYQVAIDSSYTSFRHIESESFRELTNDYHVATMRFDEPIPDSAFWPQYEPGVYINDLIAGKDYFNTPDGKPLKRTIAETKVPNGPPLVARPSANWSSWISGGGIILGVALLGVGIALKIRR